MKILFWNIGYAPGLDGSLKQYTLKGHRFLRISEKQQKLVLDEIASVISSENPDVALYAEISLGSKRNNGFDQHKYLLSKFNKVVAEGAVLKYRWKVLDKMPLHVGNANGYISWKNCKVTEAHFTVGRKTLVYIFEYKAVTIIMVHLSLHKKIRKLQFDELSVLLEAIKGPVVLCGDMNIFGGLSELSELTKKTGLQLPKNIPFTYPAFQPKLSLDMVLTRGCGVVTMSSPYSVVSDHSPIIIDLLETEND